MQGNRPEIIMPQTFAVILFLNSFKIFPTLCFYSHIILNKWSKKNIVDACYTAAFNIVLQARYSKGCIWGTDKSVFRRQRQINYTIHALICASVATASHFHHVEQTGSLERVILSQTSKGERVNWYPLALLPQNLGPEWLIDCSLAVY